LRLDDERLTNTLNGVLYAAGDRQPGRDAASARQVRFEYRDTAGLHVLKQFDFEPEPYRLAFRLSVTERARPLSPAIEWGPALASAGTETSSYVRQPGGLLFHDGAIERLQPDDIAAQPLREGDFRYAGVDDHYFVAAAINPGTSKVTFQPVTVPPPLGSETPARRLVAYAIEPSDREAPLTFFAGPKDFDVLAGVDRELVRAIDFGMFAFLVVPLLRSLNWINGYIGNYGLSIIALTIVINALMFPLRHKSVVSMRKMQEIQPEAKAIQERYAKLKTTDPARQKMNQELIRSS
jgi:YidC/Oxa1 family membrane protein insertase